MYCSPVATVLTGHIYSAFQCANLELRRSTVSSNSFSQMALLKELYYGAIYGDVLELTVQDTLVWGIAVPNAG